MYKSYLTLNIQRRIRLWFNTFHMRIWMSSTASRRFAVCWKWTKRICEKAVKSIASSLCIDIPARRNTDSSVQKVQPSGSLFRHSAAKSLSRPHAFRRVAPSVKVLEKSPEKQDIRRLSATDDTKIWLRRIGSSLCTALLLFRREQGIDRSCAVSVESHGWLRIWLRRLPGNTGETFVIPLHFDYSLKFCANFPYPLDFEWTPCYNPTWTISDVSFTEGAAPRKIVASNDHKCNALSARVSEEAALRGRDFFCR